MTAGPSPLSPPGQRPPDIGPPAQEESRSPLANLGVLDPTRWVRSSRPSGTDRDGRHSVLDRVLDTGIYVALVVLVGYFAQASPYFLTQRNLLNVGAAVAVTGVLAVGLTIALIAGQLDLTVGANVALTSVVVAIAIEDLGWSTPAGVALGLVVGVAVGLANTVLVVGIGINSIIATLAMGIVLRGVALISTGGQTKPLTNLALPEFLQERPLGVPSSVWILAAAFVASWVVLTFTRVGWHIYGVGDNPGAALRAGIRTRQLYAGVFVTTGVLAAIGGIITTGTSSSGGPNYANGAEFDVLTAVLLGGIGLGGGSGRVQRTLAGVLMIGVLNNGLTLLSVSSYYQQLARGVVFVLAVVLGAIGERRRAR